MATIYGTNGADTKSGTGGDDVIYGYPEGGDPLLDTGDDTLNGLNGADEIHGGGGNDTLNGGNDNDSLYGDTGDDTLNGGAGDDIFYIGGANAGKDTFVGGTNYDRIYLTENTTLASLTLKAGSVEELNDNGFQLSGTSGDDTFDVSGLTALILSSAINLGGGVDSYTGHIGTDLVDGGDGNDTLNGGGGDDQLTGGKDDDTLNGGVGYDSLFGGEGNDKLSGGDENDSLYGDVGDDTLNGGAGDDIFYIGGGDADIGKDTFIGGDGNDSVYLSKDTSISSLMLKAGSVEQLYYNGFLLSGTSGVDTFDVSGLDALYLLGGDIKLGAGADNYTGHVGGDQVDGGDGNDTLNGGGGYDELTGGKDDDTLNGGDGGDELSGDAGNDTLNGGVGGDTLQGGDGNDKLSGGDDNDSLYGDAGDDTLEGGAGDDIFYVGGNDAEVGKDSFTGGDGTDYVYLTKDTAISSLMLKAGSVEQLYYNGFLLSGTGGADTFDVSGLDSLSLLSAINLGAGADSYNGSNVGGDLVDGGDGNDALNGGGGDDTLNGGKDDDTLNGGDGADQLSGEAGNDTLDGGVGGDTLQGGDGNDKLSGGDDSDSLEGGVGDDTLDGGAGDDIFYIGGSDADVGKDTLVGGDGFDYLYLSKDTSLSSLALKAGTVEQIYHNGFSLSGTSGADTFDLSGLDSVNLLGTLNLGASADTFTGHVGADFVDGGDGNDTLNGGGGGDELTGGKGDDTLNGGSGGDSLYGDAGNDKLSGGDDGDNLYGGVGDDTLDGGGGDDIFYIGGSDAEVGKDSFVGGDGFDYIYLTKDTALSSLTLKAGSVEYLYYNGFLLSGTSGADTFDLSGLETLAHLGALNLGGGADSYTGHVAADVVDGGDGNDTLSGGGGSDELTGGKGDDTLDGGADNDFFYIGGSESGKDTFIGGDGYDSVYLNDNAFLSSLILNAAAGVEQLNLLGAALFGTSGADVFDLSGLLAIGNASTIFLGDGADVYTGHVGTDNVDGEGGSDTLSYAGSDAGVTVDLSTGTATGGHAESDIFTGFENLRGSNFVDKLTGDGGVNKLEGLDGDDVLDGGASADVLVGGKGDDTFLVDTAGEVVTEAVGEGSNDTVIASATYTLTAGSEVEVLRTNDDAGVTAINLTGNALKQTIVGNAGVNVLTDGGGAADTLEGLGGNDTYRIGNSAAVITEVAGGGSDTVRSSVDYALKAAVDIETLRTDNDAGVTAINLTGNALKQTIVGNAGANILNDGAGAGVDTLNGLGGNDTYRIGNGGAIVQEAASGGTDIVMAGVSYVLKAGVEVETLRTDNDAGTSAIDLTGNELVQTIVGNAGANILSDGGTAADTLQGLGGNDTYLINNSAAVIIEAASGGADIVKTSVSYVLKAGVEVETLRTDSDAGTAAIDLTGNAFAQTIVGNAGANVLTDGGTAADTLQGLGGNDTYRIGNSAAVIVEAASGGTDTVRSSVDYVLKAGVEIETLRTDLDGGTAAINLTGNALKQTIVGNAGANILNDGGGAGADTLNGLGGNDTYRVGNSAALIVEAASGGTDIVMAAVSYALKAGVEVETLRTDNDAGTTAIDLTGNELAQTTVGNAGANVLSDGGTAADTLQGLGGNDIYKIGNAAAVIVEATGGGTDTVMAGVSYVLKAAVEVETLRTDSDAGTAAINLTGNELAQTIVGNAGVNVLTDGGGAADTLQGLGGNDTYRISNAAAVIVEVAGGGTDTVRSAVDYVLKAGVEIETMRTDNDAGASAINLTGNALKQAIVGNAGANILSDGGGAADTLNGLGGNDIYRIGNSAAVIVEAASGGTDIVMASVSYALKAGVEVETLRTDNDAGTAAIDLTGNSLAQTIVGNAGTNVLGDGGGAADTLQGLGGNDFYRIGNAATMIIEVTGGGTDTLRSAVDYVLKAGVEIEQMRTDDDAGTAAIDLTGNALKQTIVGNAGNNILSDGGGAADTLMGLGGNDYYLIGNSAAVIAEATGGGTDTLRSSVDYALKAGVEIETMRTDNDAGTAAINLTGNALKQAIVGNAGANILSDGGGAGADTLNGLGGNDIYLVGNAAAIIVEAAGGGTDSVRSSVDYVLKAGVEAEQLRTDNNAGTAGIDLTGNSLAQSVVGNAGSNIIDGAAGKDTLQGLGGQDFFVFSSALGSGNIDTIADFSIVDDTIRLENAIFTKLTATGTLDASLFLASSTGTAADADDFVLYDTDDGRLYYDADGNGAGTRVHFATLTGAPAISVDDLVVI